MMVRFRPKADRQPARMPVQALSKSCCEIALSVPYLGFSDSSASSYALEIAEQSRRIVCQHEPSWQLLG